MEQPGKDGATPLFLAGTNGFEECQLLLLRHGADEACDCATSSAG